MSTKNIKDCLDAIDSVKARLKEAITNGNNIEAAHIMGDLVSLRVAFEIEVRKGLEFDEDKAA